MIDTDKYEGHTPAPWNLTSEGHIVADDMTVVCNKYTKRIVETNHKDTQLIADAPLLLAEVKQIHEILREAFSTEAKHSGAEYLNMIARITGLI